MLNNLNLEDEDNLEFDISDFKDIEDILNSSELSNSESDSESNHSNEQIYDNYEINDVVKPVKKNESKYKLITRRIDSNRIRHKTAKNLEVYTSLVKNVKMESDNPIRCGVIIYTHFNNKTYFCLGVDSAFGDLTDFGGGVKQNETIIEGGLRELEEESHNVFGKIYPEEVSDCMAFYTNNMMIVFIKRNVKINETKKNFKNIVTDNSEVSDIYWIEKEDFISSISGKGRRIYSRVRKILYKVSDIIAAM